MAIYELRVSDSSGFAITTHHDSNAELADALSLMSTLIQREGSLKEAMKALERQAQRDGYSLAAKT